MNISWREIIWQQFGAAIDDLENALRACPDDLWRARLWDDPANEKFFLPEYWYIIYHTLFWIDLYLTGSSEGFVPPAPYEWRGLPEKPYTKEQLQTYLAYCRHKCQSTLAELTEEKANQLCTFAWIEASYMEMQLYCMRHVQEHAAHLSFMLTQHGVTGFDWVTQARSIPA